MVGVLGSFQRFVINTTAPSSEASFRAVTDRISLGSLIEHPAGRCASLLLSLPRKRSFSSIDTSVSFATMDYISRRV